MPTACVIWRTQRGTVVALKNGAYIPRVPLAICVLDDHRAEGLAVQRRRGKHCACRGGQLILPNRAGSAITVLPLQRQRRILVQTSEILQFTAEQIGQIVGERTLAVADVLAVLRDNGM